jgi:hypothetical protein
MRTPCYLDRLTLLYIIICFSTTATWLLMSRPQAQLLGRYHWLAYWLINSILLFNAWLLINAGATRKAYERKIVAAISLPAALLIANLLFPILFETGKPVATIITPLFLVLGFVATATGFIGTRGNPRNQSNDADALQARHILKDSPKILGAIAVGIVGSLAIKPISDAYLRIVGDTHLRLAAIFIMSGLVITLWILPFIIVNTITILPPPPPATP